MYQASKEILHETYHDTWRKSSLDRIALAMNWIPRCRMFLSIIVWIHRTRPEFRRISTCSSQSMEAVGKQGIDRYWYSIFNIPIPANIHSTWTVRLWGWSKSTPTPTRIKESPLLHLWNDPLSFIKKGMIALTKIIFVLSYSSIFTMPWSSQLVISFSIHAALMMRSW